MSEDERSNDSLLSLLAGMGIGVLIGATVALLLAPESGAETRRRIRERADDLGHGVRDSLEELRGRVEELVTHVRRRPGEEPHHGDVAQDTEAAPSG